MGAEYRADAGATTTDDADPRCSGAYVDTITEGDGSVASTVTLVGVVHDHPASAYRASRVVDEADPAVLALELPPLAVPLFEHYALAAPRGGTDTGQPDDFAATAGLPTGGEMTAAISATDPERVAGIDGPTVGFAARLLDQVRQTDGALHRGGGAVRELLSAWGHAAHCRLAATYAGIAGTAPNLSDPRTHEIGPEASPAAQAEDERRQVRRARSIAAAFGGEVGVAARDSAREAHMAARLRSLASEGDVVAVVGIDHLEPVADRLRGKGH